VNYTAATKMLRNNFIPGCRMNMCVFTVFTDCCIFPTVNLNNKLLTAFIFCHVQICTIYLFNMTDSCIKREKKRKGETIFSFHVHLLCTRSLNY